MAVVARPDYVVSGLLAAGVHLLLLVFLVVGLSWNRKPPEPVVVELWRDPVVTPPKPVTVAPPPRVEPPPPPPEPRPAPPPEPKPVPPPQPKPAPPKVEPKPAPEPKVADISLQEKREKEKKLREEKAAEAARAKEAEREKLEEKQKADEQRKKEDEARRKEQDAQRKEQEKRTLEDLERQVKATQEQRLANERAEAELRAAAQAAKRAQKQIDEYTRLIRDAIRKKVHFTQAIEGNPQAEFTVTLLRNGTVADARLVRSSGFAAYDKAVEHAIYDAELPPMPDDTEIYQQLRDLKLLFRPRE